ncbi:bifunctional isocitrate dehydrogenase kinase/phosphatase, partial [Escherichia coli]|uniref:bifunctional isocitrate dehydrogenase kinase/phosphatase n=1 Tax=Escherichia coli TaxID=562 RepID=UPI0010CC423D
IGPLFEEMHADLFRADDWRALQNRIREGHEEAVYAYRPRQRRSFGSVTLKDATTKLVHHIDGVPSPRL